MSDLNDQGQAVGWAETPDGAAQAIHLDLPGAYTLLKGAGSRSAAGVNNLHQIVGKDGDLAAFWSSPAANPVPLPPLPPSTGLPAGTTTVSPQSGGLDINDAGIVIGVSEEGFAVDNGDGTQESVTRMTAVVWRVLVNGSDVSVDGPRPLSPLPGHMESFAGLGSVNELIENSAQVAGYSSAPGREAVVWRVELKADGMLDTPGLPESLAASPSDGFGINNLGDVCGSASGWPFVALASGEPQLLPLPKGTKSGDAYAINDRGEVVGQLDIQKGSPHGPILPPQYYASLWRDGERIDLNTRIPSNSGWDRLKWATTINNDGVIGGWGRYDVNHRGFVLIPDGQ